MAYGTSKWLKSCTITAALLTTISATALADDGVTLIDQSKALLGNVTPGDTPGFPVTLSQPGSYRLSGNLTVSDIETTAIEIAADDVSLDLNGFRIRGPAFARAGNGISASTPAGGRYGFSSVTNGSISGFGYGLVLGANSIVMNLRVHNNGSAGIWTGPGSLVVNNIVADNALGMFVSERSVIRANTVSGAGSGGTVLLGCPGSFVGNAGNVGSIMRDTGGKVIVDPSCIRAQNSPAP